MKKLMSLLGIVAMSFPSATDAQALQRDTLQTSDGPLEITFVGHGSLMFTFQDKIIHVDPYSALTDYSKLPQADLILLTHEHMDHMDHKALGTLRTEKTLLVVNQACAEEVRGGIIMQNGDQHTVMGIKIEAVPAYNIVHTRSPGQPFHPRGSGNGYILTFGDKRVYIAGDTENIPEMAELKAIDVAFLPMNLPYTMTPEMAAEAANSFKPHILYPYHYGNSDTSKLLDLLQSEPAIEVRIRNMQ